MIERATHAFAAPTSGPAPISGLCGAEFGEFVDAEYATCETCIAIDAGRRVSARHPDPRATYVREFSAIGPCLTLGTLVKRTASTITFEEKVWVGGERKTKVSRRGGFRVKRGLIHTEPCGSCMDHPHTQYPDGYMN